MRDPNRARSGDGAGRAALVVAVLALVMSMTGLGSAATSAAKNAISGLVDGHHVSLAARPGAIPVLGANGKLAGRMIPKTVNAARLSGKKVSARSRPNAIPVLGRNGKLAAKMIPTSGVDATKLSGKTASAQAKANSIPVLGHNGKLASTMIPTGLDATTLGGMSVVQLTGSCPAQTVDLGTWCLMDQPYTLTAAESQAGVNNYAWASQACVALGGFLPSADELIGAAPKVRLESVYTDNPSTATIDYNDDGGIVSVALDQREMSSTLITTAAGSDAAGSEGVSAGSTPSTPGQPAPVPQPAVPYPPTLQYVTVYSNGTKGGFAGSEPVSTPENFRCGFYLKQTIPAPQTTTTTSTTTTPTATTSRSTTTR